MLAPQPSIFLTKGFCAVRPSSPFREKGGSWLTGEVGSLNFPMLPGDAYPPITPPPPFHLAWASTNLLAAEAPLAKRDSVGRGLGSHLAHWGMRGKA